MTSDKLPAKIVVRDEDSDGWYVATLQYTERGVPVYVLGDYYHSDGFDQALDAASVEP